MTEQERIEDMERRLNAEVDKARALAGRPQPADNWKPETTDDVMARVSPVVAVSIRKLEEITGKCESLIKQLNAHESSVRAMCMERDQRTRALIENAARFAQAVDEECKRAEAAIGEMAAKYELESADKS